MSQKETEKRMASSIRKGKYKKILVKGGQFAEEIGSRSVVENLKIIQRLSRETDAVHAEGTIQDRIGQSSEVLLDSQVITIYSNVLYLFIIRWQCIQRRCMKIKFVLFFMQRPSRWPPICWSAH